MITPIRNVVYGFGLIVSAVLIGNMLYLVMETISEAGWKMELVYYLEIIVPLLLIGLAILFGVKAYKDPVGTSKTKILSAVSLAIVVYILIATFIV